MSDPETPSVPPPFDVVPETLDQDEESEEQVSLTSRFRNWRSYALPALFVAMVGLGQGLGLTMLFGDKPEPLSAPVAKQQEKSSPAPDRHPSDPTGTSDPAHPTQHADEHGTGNDEDEVDTEVDPAPPHDLEVARERFEMGDVEWARRTSAAFLLRLDGLGHEDTRRASEAYALLADVLRHEYEESLLDEIDGLEGLVQPAATTPEADPGHAGGSATEDQH